MYGTQTVMTDDVSQMLFENDVEMYGTQTSETGMSCATLFENDVGVRI